MIAGNDHRCPGNKSASDEHIVVCVTGYHMQISGDLYLLAKATKVVHRSMDVVSRKAELVVEFLGELGEHFPAVNDLN